jgi:uncharacterized protein
MIQKKNKKIFLLTIFGFLFMLTAFRISLPFFIINKMVNMHVNFSEVWKAEEFGITANHFVVKTDDGFNISAYEVAAINPKAILVCLSGIHNPSATAYLGHAKLFLENGYATVFFDMRAHGESDGDMICMGYKEYLDTKAIIKHIKENPVYRYVPVIIFGISMGASTAIISAGEIPEIDGLISLSAFSSWEDIFYDKMINWSPRFFASLEKPFVIFSTMVKYNVNSRLISPVNEIEKLGNRPALLMHSEGDTQVPYANLERILSHAPSHVETFTREGDYHLIVLGRFTEPEKDVEYTDVLLKFLDKNFGDKIY